MQKRRKIKVMLTAMFVLAAIMAFACHASSVTLMYDDVRYSASDPLISDNGTTYVSIRALSSMRGEFSAEWNEYTETAKFESNGIKMTVKAGEDQINANGMAVPINGTARLANGRVYVPIRALSKVFGAETTYDETTNTISLKTVSNYIGSNSEYSWDDLYWLSRIISAESCDEPYAGKIMVGNVVMNRKRNSQFPDSVYGVIFDKTNAVQFTPVSNGTVYNNPCDECTAAAKAVLSGASRTDKALYFVNTDIVPVSWVSTNRPAIMRIGGHTFFS